MHLKANKTRFGFKILKFALVFIPVIFLGCASVNISAIQMLIKLWQNDKLKQQALKEETENYNTLKQYITNNKIEQGLASNFIIDNFGEPVIILPYSEGEKWAYKPAEADWIKGEKIYLFFDKYGKLTNWGCFDSNKIND